MHTVKLIVPMSDIDFDEASCGVTALISWNMLEDILIQQGLLREDEHLRGLKIFDMGISYYPENVLKMDTNIIKVKD